MLRLILIILLAIESLNTLFFNFLITQLISFSIPVIKKYNHLHMLLINILVYCFYHICQKDIYQLYAF